MLLRTQTTTNSSPICYCEKTMSRHSTGAQPFQSSYLFNEQMKAPSVYCIVGACLHTYPNTRGGLSFFQHLKNLQCDPSVSEHIGIILALIFCARIRAFWSHMYAERKGEPSQLQNPLANQSSRISKHIKVVAYENQHNTTCGGSIGGLSFPCATHTSCAALCMLHAVHQYYRMR